MIIKTVDELRQRIGKFVVFSQYNQDFKDPTASMKLLTRVEDGWLKHADRLQTQLSDIYGYEIYGKFSAQIYPFIPYVKDKNGETFSNTYMYARDATEEEIKQFRQNWRLAIYKNKIKPKQRYTFEYPHIEDYELPF
jgi:hypothetical protein